MPDISSSTFQPKARQPYIHPSTSFSGSLSHQIQPQVHGPNASHSWKDVPLHVANGNGNGNANGTANGHGVGNGTSVTDGQGSMDGLNGTNNGRRASSPSLSTGRRPPLSSTLSNASSSTGSLGSLKSSPLSSMFRFASDLLPSSVKSSSVGVAGNVKFILLCSLWYMSSAISSNTGKAIFNVFKFPVTLTLVQFIFIAFFSWAWTSPVIGMGKLRRPSRQLLRGVLPMAAFQVGGHVFSSVATSRVPVSTVHTIKALSPLFTVLSYRFLFNVSYSSATYMSLVPLTLGVMFACSFDVSASNVFGLVCAFGSTLVFVSSNIFFKKIVPSSSAPSGSSKDDPNGTNAKLDKINLLFYSSSLAFLFMVPLWLYSDALNILADSADRAALVPAPPSRTKTVLYYFVLNGSSHFLQNVLAFTILSSTSPVTYSIASLVKRIVVIVMAIVWFRQTVHPIQALGIGLTFVGLYMYQNAKGEVEKMEKKVRKIEAIRDGSFLPSSNGDAYLMSTEKGSKVAGGPIGGDLIASAFGATSSNDVSRQTGPQFLPPPPSGGLNSSLRNHHPHPPTRLYAAGPIKS
ncbi:tpt-domain-containing protein [Phaffia rhodozyma]|uniref:Tpt-domain-containing protein n=1 Tax=Phaffia rhodozyma TaxID=264483 RepID=A0A0F7SM28_PHARH|nr:tpt-domain-containing protein [Phaffia rhodozyma]